jgi:hypothetical protein
VSTTEALKRLAEIVRTRSFPYEMDVAAADEVEHLGLIDPAGDRRGIVSAPDER